MAQTTKWYIASYLGLEGDIKHINGSTMVKKKSEVGGFLYIAQCARFRAAKIAV